MLDDGSKLEYPEAEVKYESLESYGGSIIYKYYAYVVLDDDDIKKLCASAISDYRLYIYDGTVRDKHKERFRQYINCIKDK